MNPFDKLAGLSRDIAHGAKQRDECGPPTATVTMNPSIDQHILIDRLIKDDAIRARDFPPRPGGKGIKVSPSGA
jgi:hypothetical protein